MGKFSLPPDLTQQIDASSDDVLDRMARALSQLNVDLRSIVRGPCPRRRTGRGGLAQACAGRCISRDGVTRRC
ncbi:MAG: hypothetical protein Q8M96_05930, partial [Rubrivivax sp.]|nr:hypothetical protein [Rubrivivax sp.]